MQPAERCTFLCQWSQHKVVLIRGPPELLFGVLAPGVLLSGRHLFSALSESSRASLHLTLRRGVTEDSVEFFLHSSFTTAKFFHEAAETATDASVETAEEDDDNPSWALRLDQEVPAQLVRSLAALESPVIHDSTLYDDLGRVLAGRLQQSAHKKAFATLLATATVMRMERQVRAVQGTSGRASEAVLKSTAQLLSPVFHSWVWAELNETVQEALTVRVYACGMAAYQGSELVLGAPAQWVREVSGGAQEPPPS
jgi:hypothetical protein